MGQFNKHDNVFSGLWLKKVNDDSIRLSPGSLSINGDILTLQEYVDLALSGSLLAGESELSDGYEYLYAYNGRNIEPDPYTKLLIHSDNYPLTAWDNSYRAFQSIPTNSAFDWQFFTIGSDYYLAVANYRTVSTYNVDSKIYKWNGANFQEFQSISTNGAYSWEFFTIGTEYYLAVANFRNDSTYNVDSKIYKWDGDSFELFQSIPTNGTHDWEFFTIGLDYYLAVANSYDDSSYNINSKIYKWNGDSFELFQSIPTNGAYSWEFFTIGTDYYLAVANSNNGSTRNIDSKIYKWDGNSFEEFQSIPTNGAFDWEFFTIGTDYYLAVANYYNDSTWNIDSKIYKWNGISFELFQSIATNGAISWEFFNIGTDYYLAIANRYGGSYNIDSKIYKWDGDSFELFQSIPTNGARDWKFFTIGFDYYLAVANSYNNSTWNIDSKIYKLTDAGFVDSSLSNHSISRVGNTVHLTDEKKFGSSAIYFDGDGDYLSIPDSEDFNFGTGDFTIDFWVNFAEYPNNDGGAYQIYLIGQDAEGNRGPAFYVVGTSNTIAAIYFAHSAAQQMISYAYSFSLDTWYHLAFVRGSGTGHIYINGIDVVSGAIGAINNATGVLKIGAHLYNSTYLRYLNGYIDELRISKGIARWTENFTPDTSPYNILEQPQDGMKYKFSAVKPSKDQFGNTIKSFTLESDIELYHPNNNQMRYIGKALNIGGNINNVDYNPSEIDEYTKLLIHSDSVDNGAIMIDGVNTVFTDRSSSAHVITRVGNTIHSVDQKMFGNSSIYFDGSGDYLTVPSSEDFNLKEYDSLWTIDFLAYTIIGSEMPTFLSIGVDNNGSISISIFDNFVKLWVSTNGSTATYVIGSEINYDTWYHYAIVNNNGIFRVYVNGIGGEFVELTSDIILTNYTLKIGQVYNFHAAFPFKGYIDELRISKGIARWTENFIPPTNPYIKDEFTKLLIHSNYNYTPSFEDSSPSNHIITAVGQVNHIIEEKKFGSSAIYFDGDGDYLTIPDSEDWDLGLVNDPFTIDVWCKTNNTDFAIFGKDSGNAQWNGTNGYHYFFIYQGSVLYFSYWDGSSSSAASWATDIPKNGNWNHLAVVYDGTTVKLYINGITGGSTSTTPFLQPTNESLINIGRLGTGEVPLNGYIDELRISKGVARWTENFTPPNQHYW